MTRGLSLLVPGMRGMLLDGVVLVKGRDGRWVWNWWVSDAKRAEGVVGTNAGRDVDASLDSG